jgi:hypothetical protein
MGLRHLLRRYAFAWGFVGCFALAQLGYALLSPHAQVSVVSWASTSVANLERDPIGCLVFSAVVTGGTSWAWPVLLAVALVAAVHVAGNRRTIVACVAGHVVGSLVSEGIVAYRVHTGALPPAYRHLTDVGPSYVVVAALVLALAHGWRYSGWRYSGCRSRKTGTQWRARIAAALDLAILIFAGNIFGGLSTLEVAAVGHVTAMVTAGLVALASERVAHPEADQVGDRGGAYAEEELASGTAPERSSG